MDSKESIAFLRGLIEGSELELGKKESKIMDALLDTLTTLANEIGTTNERVDDLEDAMGDVYGTLEMVSHTLMHALHIEGYNEDEDEDDDDDGMYSIHCPNCGEVIFIDDEAWDDGSVVCYECGQVIDLADEDEDFLDDDEDD